MENKYEVNPIHIAKPHMIKVVIGRYIQAKYKTKFIQNKETVKVFEFF